MKKLIFTLVLLSSGLAFSAETMTLKVNGMTCGSCVNAIKGKFADVNEVKSTDVDLETKRVQVEFHDGKTLSEDKLKVLIEEAGYEFAGVVKK